MKHLDVAIAIVFRDSRVLIARRKRGGVLGGYWEFPGGKLEAGETLHDCVRRELQEEMGILVHPVVSLTPIPYQYPDRHVTLHAFLCTHDSTGNSGEPKPLASEELRWVTPAELRTTPFPPANQQLIEQVIAALPLNPSPSPQVKVTRQNKSPRQPIVA